MVFGLRDVLPPDARYLTVLRDPVERTLSHYGYLVAPRDVAERPHGLLARTTPYRPDLTLEEALADPRYLPDNLQTRMLVCSRSPFEELPPMRSTAPRSTCARSPTSASPSGWTTSSPRSAGLAAAEAQAVGERPPRESLTAAQLRAVEEHDALDLELFALAAGSGRRRPLGCTPC